MKNARIKETFKQGLGGGILGACIGVPGLGVAVGVINANKDKIKKFGKEVMYNEKSIKTRNENRKRT